MGKKNKKISGFQWGGQPIDIYNSIFAPQNPGIDGLDELTSAETAWVINAAGLTYALGTMLVSDTNSDLNALPVGTNGQILVADSNETLGVKWSTESGLGDVVGPASATDDAIATFDLITGKLIQNTVVTIAQSTGNIVGAGTLNTHTIPGGTGTFALTSDLASYLALAGGTMAGAIVMGTNKITGMGDPTAAQDAATKAYHDAGFIDTEIHGFTDNTETTVGFNDSTYVFTLTDAGSGWSYYRDGLKYTISGNKTTTLSGAPPSTNTYFVVIDTTDGTLSNSTSSWNLTDSKVAVAIIYWNDTLTPKYVLADERHTATFNKTEHAYEHLTYGTRLQSSGAVSGYTLSSDVDANKQYDVAQTKIWDEDLQSTLTATTGGSDNYHIAYRTGASTWVWEQGAHPFDYTGAGYINYDSSGTMTQGANNKWYTTYIISTNQTGLSRYTIIHGQAQFDSLAEAQAEQFTDLTLTNLDVAEGVATWKLIWKTSSSYTSTGKCVLIVDPIPVNTNIITAPAAPGLGTMSTQDADDVHITDGIIETGVQFVDGTDNTIAWELDISGATTAKTMTFLSSHTDNRTLTFPDATGTLALNNQTMYIGTTAVNINRTSAALVLSGITSIDGEAATVVTNANLTGIVTSSGNATAIADKAIAIAKLADGTDGQLITWDTNGVIAVVTTGNDGDVLTSGGVGTAPTFEAPTGGGDVSKVGTPANNQLGIWTGDGTIEGDVDLLYDGTDLLVGGTAAITKIQFRDAAVFINSATDGHLDLDADVSIDLNASVVLSGSISLGGHAVDDLDITSEASDADDHLMTALAVKNRIDDLIGAISSITLGGHTISDIDLASEFNDVDDHVMSSAAIQDKILGYGYSTEVGTITAVTGTAPVVSSGGTTPVISMAAANTTVDGYLTTTDWDTFNEKAEANQTFYIGTTQVAINRSSAALTLAGITLTTPNIGTPSAGNLANCTALPAAALAAGIFGGAMVTVDHGAAATAQVISVAYGTGAAPIASDTPIGSLYITYTA